jgi:hypothetical protein
MRSGGFENNDRATFRNLDLWTVKGLGLHIENDTKHHDQRACTNEKF